MLESSIFIMNQRCLIIKKYFINPKKKIFIKLNDYRDENCFLGMPEKKTSQNSDHKRKYEEFVNSTVT